MAQSIPAPAQSVILPFDTANDMILVHVRINGGEYLMLLDTGAQHTIVGQLNQNKGKNRSKDTNAGLLLNASGIKATIEFKGMPIIKTHILEANLEDFGKRFGDARVNGILGQDLLSLFSYVRIDYKAHQIEMVKL